VKAIFAIPQGLAHSLSRLKKKFWMAGTAFSCKIGQIFDGIKNDVKI
jgi:hypothetical protein